MRSKGLDDAEKRLAREATEGLIAVKKSGNKVTMIEVNCETDFVAKTDRFISGVTKIIDGLHEFDFGSITGDQCTDKEKVEEIVNQGKLVSPIDEEFNDLELQKVIRHLISKVQENCVISRIYSDSFDSAQHEAMGFYVHNHLVKEDDYAIGKVGSVTKMVSNGKHSDLSLLAKNLAMHNAAMKPHVIFKDDPRIETLGIEKK